MITNEAQVKLVGKITGVTYNNLIAEQIPVVAELIRKHTGTSFISTKLVVSETNNGYEEYEAPGISTHGDYVLTGNTITATSSSFSDFQVGDNIFIGNSIRNNGYFTITEITDTVITVAEDLNDEEEYLFIYLVIYPKYVQNVAARMVAWDILERDKAIGLDSIKVEGYSAKYRRISGSSYPQDVVAGLECYHNGR